MYPIELLLPIVSAILSTGAFIVAMITLWFSHLKGPDIGLCNVPIFRIQEEVVDRWSLGYIPSHLEFEPIQLIFTNNGSRAGVITEIEPSFVPSEEFRPFYKGTYARATRQWPERSKDSYSDLPVSIREGDNCVVVLNLHLNLPDWRDHIRSEQLSDLSNIKDVVEQSLNLDKRDFINFLEFIQTKKSLGELSLELVATSKKTFSTKLKKKEIVHPFEVEIVPGELKYHLKTCLENWDVCHPTIGELLDDIPEFLNRFIEPMKKNLDQLKEQITAERLPGLLDLESELRYIKEHGSDAVKLVMRREKLERAFDEISKRARQFNSEMRLVRATRPDIEKEMIAHMNAVRKELEQLHKETLKNLNKRKKELTKELA